MHNEVFGHSLVLKMSHIKLGIWSKYTLSGLNNP